MENIESYAPVLRRTIIESTEAEQGKSDDPPAPAVVERIHNRVISISIPVIDLERLEMETETLREACRNWGVFRLENHGIPSAVTSQLLEVSKALLNLPFETKPTLLSASPSPLSYFWGTPALTSSGSAVERKESSGDHVSNLVEGFNVPIASISDINGEHPLLEPFGALMEEYGRHLTRVAVTLFEAISRTINLDITGKRRSEYLAESTGYVRIYRYPRISGEAMGMEVHTDSSVISILNQDEVGGLEFIKDGEWYTIEPLPNTLIVNIGDMLQAMSNDEYKSVKHKVAIKKGRERYSICYFVFPDKDCVIESDRYKPFTYADFQSQVQLDLKTLGSKVGLARFSSSSPS